MFRTGFLSIIRSLVLYTQQQVYVTQVLLTACERDQYVSILIPLAVSYKNMSRCTVLWMSNRDWSL